jgi:alpha-N-acetylglucosamine transferase
MLADSWLAFSNRPNVRRVAVLLLATFAILSGIFILRHSLSNSKPFVAVLDRIHLTGQAADNKEDGSAPRLPADHKYAFATFLAKDRHSENVNNDDVVNYDVYYTGARILAYQLCHAPETRTDIPFMVLVTPDVEKQKREQLRKDGAIIYEVEPVDPGFALTEHEAWSDVMTKLRLWQLTQFERIAFLDADVILLRNLDALFDDAAAKEQKTLSVGPESKKGVLPSTYVFASNAETSYDHDWPPVKPGIENDIPFPWYFNAGLFILRPDPVLFDYYVSLTLDEPLRFDPALPEQNLLNWAHRIQGGMPWHQIDRKWISHHTTAQDIEGGVYAAHEHYWDPLHPDAQPYLVAKKAEMEAYFAARDALEKGPVKEPKVSDPKSKPKGQQA